MRNAQETQAAPEAVIEERARVQDQEPDYVMADLPEKTRFSLEAIAATLKMSLDLAEVLQHASILPEHLRTRRLNGKIVDLQPSEIKANCVLVCNQALRWEVDPFALIGESYVVGGKLAFQGKLIAAIINRSLSSRLTPTYTGEGDSRVVTVTGTIKGERTAKRSRVEYLLARTYDKEGAVSSAWSDVDQKLWYSGATKWARLHLPEVLMGVLAEEEGLQDETPAQGTDEIVGTTANAAVIEFFVDRIGAADHQGQLERIVLESKGSRISEIEKEIVASAAREIYKDLPTAEDFHGLSEPERTRPGYTETGQKIDTPEAKAAQAVADQDFQAAKKAKKAKASNAAMKETVQGFLVRIAYATKASEINAIRKDAQDATDIDEGGFQVVSAACDEALS